MQLGTCPERSTLQEFLVGPFEGETCDVWRWIYSSSSQTTTEEPGIEVNALEVGR